MSAVLSRRLFLAAAAATAWPSLTSRAHTATAAPLRVGLIGCGIRGRSLTASLPATAKIVALCDCATSRIDEMRQPTAQWRDIIGRFARTVAAACQPWQDYRRMIDAGGLDAVLVATPDHHHVPAATHALEAGLHVYLEKPVSLRIAEGRALVETATASGRVLQVGSQQRSMAANRRACQFVREGGLGPLSRVRLPNYPGPLRDPDWSAEPIPADLDWRLFLGNATLRPHNRRLWVKDRFDVDGVPWRGWDLYRDYSGHLTTNWGAHSIDMVQLALGRDETGPVRVEPLAVDEEMARRLAADWHRKWHKKTPAPGGSFAAESRFHPVALTYADGLRVELLPGVANATFEGAAGRLEIPRNKFKADPKSLLPPPSPSETAEWEGPGFVARPHLQNWLDAIAGRAALHAPVEAGHRTATVCHLINIARQLGRPLDWDPAAERFVGDDEANGLRGGRG